MTGLTGVRWCPGVVRSVILCGEEARWVELGPPRLRIRARSAVRPFRSATPAPSLGATDDREADGPVAGVVSTSRPSCAQLDFGQRFLRKCGSVLAPVCPFERLYARLLGEVGPGASPTKAAGSQPPSRKRPSALLIHEPSNPLESEQRKQQPPQSDGVLPWYLRSLLPHVWTPTGARHGARQREARPGTRAPLPRIVRAPRALATAKTRSASDAHRSPLLSFPPHPLVPTLNLSQANCRSTLAASRSLATRRPLSSPRRPPSFRRRPAPRLPFRPSRLEMASLNASLAADAKAPEYTSLEVAPPAYQPQAEDGFVGRTLDLLGSRSTQGRSRAR